MSQFRYPCCTAQPQVACGPCIACCFLEVAMFSEDLAAELESSGPQLHLFLGWSREYVPAKAGAYQVRQDCVPMPPKPFCLWWLMLSCSRSLFEVTNGFEMLRCGRCLSGAAGLCAHASQAILPLLFVTCDSCWPDHLTSQKCLGSVTVPWGHVFFVGGRVAAAYCFPDRRVALVFLFGMFLSSCMFVWSACLRFATASWQLDERPLITDCQRAALWLKHQQTANTSYPLRLAFSAWIQLRCFQLRYFKSQNWKLVCLGVVAVPPGAVFSVLYVFLRWFEGFRRFFLCRR